MKATSAELLGGLLARRAIHARLICLRAALTMRPPPDPAAGQSKARTTIPDHHEATELDPAAQLAACDDILARHQRRHHDRVHRRTSARRQPAARGAMTAPDALGNADADLREQLMAAQNV